MSESENNPLFNLKVVRGKEFAEQQGLTTGEEGERSPEEDWNINVNAVKQLSRAKQWEKCFDALVYLSTRESNPLMHAAMAQRIWLALKGDIAILDVTTSLSAMQIMLGEKHGMAGPLASLANLLCQSRGQDDPELELAQSQVQQMFELAASEGAGVTNEEEFKDWVEANHLHEPDVFIPFIMEMLEAMVGPDNWWLDRDSLQEELDSHNEEKSN
uniref:Uncharacterized protein n=1 Tax=Magnetococcus massalia (strain MO-1) TaxID=451514 RepID=A0A1S7LIA3_MAGMO|nr:conserved protein of unknown function [Candidatus Magnetococcus massalia]